MKNILLAVSLVLASAGTAFAECQYITEWRCVNGFCAWATVWRCQPTCRNVCVWRYDAWGNYIQVCSQVCE